MGAPRTMDEATAPVPVRRTGVDRRAWAALAIAAASYITILDPIAVSVAFPAIEKAFPATPRTTLAWVSTGYSIALAALLLVAGRLADRYGRRRTYLTGMAIFPAAACVAAAAPSPALLIAGRLVEGGAAALIISPAIALALPRFPPHRRGVAMGWLGAAGATASLLGPVVAGNLLSVAPWRAVLLLAVPICIVALVSGPRVLADEPAGGDVGPLDLTGVVTGTASVALLTLAITQSARWGWAAPATLGCLAASALLGVLFLRRCAVHESPLVRLELFRRARFGIATVSQVGTQLAIMAWFFSTPLFLVNVWGWTAAGAGWAIALAMFLGLNAIPVGSFADRHGYRGVLVGGGIVAAGGMVWWLLTASAEPRFGTMLLPGLLIFGFGSGMVGVTGTSAALDGLDAAELSVANAAHQTARRLSQTLGTAVAVAVLGDRTSESLARFRAVWLLVAVGYLLSSVVALAYPAHRSRRRADQPTR